jgi:RhtB (resistance to homoserine/threonine) family protein
MLIHYWAEFTTIAVIHLLAVASPGPDFAIVLKQSINQGRKVAIYTSLGIGTGILVHVAYSLVGLGLLIASSPWLFNAFKYVAAGYFCYIAWHGLRAKAPVKDQDVELSLSQSTQKPAKAFATGFFINALNIKATLFFISLFSLVISLDTPIEVKLVYGLYMALATASWFSLLSYLLSMRNIRLALLNKGYWLDRLMGLVLLLLAIELVFSDLPVVSN